MTSFRPRRVPRSGTTPPAETPEETAARALRQAETLRGLGVARDVLDATTELLGFATTALRTSYDQTRAEAIYNTELVAIRERAGLATADAYARATLAVAQRLIRDGRSAEQIAAGRRLLEQAATDVARQQELAALQRDEDARKRRMVVGYAVAAASVVGLVVLVVTLRKSRRPTSTTRRPAR